MRAVVIMGSARADGNTAHLIGELSTHLPLDLVNLLDFNINYFDYLNEHRDDDFLPLMEDIVTNYDVIIFATPVYWYSMSAQLKTFIDRFSDFLKFEKDLGRQLREKSMAVLACGYADDLVDGFFSPFQHTAKYLGINYVAEVYGYATDNGPLDPLVIERIAEFANQLKSQQ